MSITSIPVETPKHFSQCDSIAIGRRVKQIALVSPGHQMSVSDLAIPVAYFREDCSCFELQLTRVEADLKARRAGQRAGFDNEAEIAALLVARDALRAVIK